MSSSVNERLDVLQVTEACAGGVRRHLELILPALAARGLHCGLFAFSGRADADFFSLQAKLLALGCPVEWLELSTGMSVTKLWGARSCLQAMLLRYRPRCLHLQAGWAGLLGRAACLSLPPGLRVIYSPHAFGFHPEQPCWRKILLPLLEKKLSHKTSAYVLIGSEELAEAKRLGLPEQKLFLAENGLAKDFPTHLLPRDEARRHLGIPLSEKAFLVPCRLAWQKGLDLLLPALANSPLPEPSPIFYLCGEGPEKASLLALAEKLGLLPILRFSGNIPSLWQSLLSFDGAILPSRYEGLSYALLECLAAGLPVLASDIKANMISDQIIPFQSGQSSSLAEALPRLWNSKPSFPKIPDGAAFLSSQIDKLLKVYSPEIEKKPGIL